jgi:transcriptional regulator with XRE-family HTH domain
MHQLAEKIGTTHSYISQLEGGRLRPSVDVAAHLAGVFSVSVDELIGRAEEVQSTPVLTNPLLDRIQGDLLVIDAHNPDALEHLAPLVEAVREKAMRDHRHELRAKRSSK